MRVEDSVTTDKVPTTAPALASARVLKPSLKQALKGLHSPSPRNSKIGKQRLWNFLTR
jgi:hypothetical protein